MGQSPSSSSPSEQPNGLHPPSPLSPMEFFDCESIPFDYNLTADLPNDCLSHIFNLLTPSDRKRCSLVCKRWHLIDAQNRHRLSLDARSEILPHLPSLFARFDSVTKLALRCDRKYTSLNDVALITISIHCRNLTRVRLRGCRAVTDLGMESFAKNCNNLKKFSCGSCMFGSKGINAMIEHCKLLEELSIKRFKGIHEELIQSSSLRSVYLKEIVNINNNSNGQVFESLVGTKTLKKLKIIRCLGNWDKVLQMNSSLTEIHLDRVQVSDVGLFGISKCSKLESLHIVKTIDCSNFGLASVVERCKLLRKIHIDGWRTWRISDMGLLAVAKHCLNLQELVLIGVNATYESLSAIGLNCKKLERLALCGSGTIGDMEIVCIAEKCLALKKFCIKGCPVTDVGIKAIGLGCPNLVKLKVKKCRLVTLDVWEWLRERRRMLVVSIDGDDFVLVDGGDQGGVEIVVEEPQQATPPPVSEGGGRLAMLKNKLGLLAGRNFVACTFRRWSQSEATT